MSDVNIELVRTVARVLWSMQGDIPKDKEARKAAFQEAKPEAVKTARKLVRQLERRGVSLTLDPEAAVKA